MNIVEPFAYGDSFIHRIDPRVKIVIAAMFSLVVALSYDFTGLLGSAALSLTLLIAARLSVKKDSG
jgi:cobalt/nickel transport system permease protein